MPVLQLGYGIFWTHAVTSDDSATYIVAILSKDLRSVNPLRRRSIASEDLGSVNAFRCRGATSKDLGGIYTLGGWGFISGKYSSSFDTIRRRRVPSKDLGGVNTLGSRSLHCVVQC
jgi:hypothetical protein